MWRASEQEALGLDGNFLPQQQQQAPKNSHDNLFHRQHQTSQPQLSAQHTGDFMRAQTPGQANNVIAHGLPQALLAEAGQGHAADLPNMQLDLDSVTLSAALGLGGDNALAHCQRNLGDQNGQSSSDLSAILAASLGALPGQTSIGSLLGQDGLTHSLGGASAMSSLPHMLPQSSLISSKDSDSLANLQKTSATNTRRKSSVDIDEHAESDEHSEGEGSAGTKRKGPMTEEDKKRRRQEINRQSARRIRERRSHEMERLKQQNAVLQAQQAQLLKYASALAREKHVLVQRTMELTERWNQAAAENIELREQAKARPSSPDSAPTAAATYRQSQAQSGPPQDPEQGISGQQAGSESEPTFAQ